MFAPAVADLCPSGTHGLAQAVVRSITASARLQTLSEIQATTPPCATAATADCEIFLDMRQCKPSSDHESLRLLPTMKASRLIG